jgi:hypothetical protein
MTKAIAVRREGDAFQSRIFWRRAACLLDPASPVIKVGFESGPKGFDDVWVEYAEGRGPDDQEGIPLRREHIQCKWHVSINDYGHADLVDPDWINATSFSLLHRAHEAQLKYAADGKGARFKLLTNWRIAQADPLRELIYQRSKTLRLEELFGPKTDRSAAGGIRKVWRDHLGISDAELRILARTLALDTDSTSLDDHRDNLDLMFENRGLRRIPANESSFVYDDLTYQWLGQGRLEFDRSSFREACAKQGLLSNEGKAYFVYGVKSFEHAFDRLEDRCTDVLNLIPHFDGRAIHSQNEWKTALYPKLQSFLQAAARDNTHLRLVLDSHITLAFAAGSVLNIKAGRSVEIEQRTLHRQVWRAGDSERDPAWPKWQFETNVINADEKEIAVAVSLTHDVSAAVAAFLARSGPRVGTLVVAKPTCPSGARSVASGQHAFDLAEALVQHINVERLPSKAPLHLFIAAPNAFTFFLGQRQAALGPLTLYEYDFEGDHGGSYEASFSLPM